MKKICIIVLSFIMIISMTACDLSYEKIIDKFDIDEVFENMKSHINTNKNSPINSEINNTDSQFLQLTKKEYRKSNYANPVSVTLYTTYENIGLTDEYANKYPELAKSVNKSMITINDNFMETYDMLEDVANNINGYNNEIALNADTQLFVQRADSTILSYIIYSQGYSGGVHGWHTVYGDTYDVQTGKKISLPDITTDKYTLANIIYNKLTEKYTSNVFFDVSSIDDHITDNFDKLSWVMGYNGVTFFFNEYEIAPYASGLLDVLIPFDEIPGLNPEYMEIPQSYTVEIAPNINYIHDLEGNGTLNKLRFYSYENSEYNTQELGVYIDEIDHKLPESLYEAKAVLVHMGDGQDYLYTECSYESDTGAIYTHKLTHNGIDEISCIDETFRYSISHDPSAIVYYPMTDPSNFDLGEHISVLSTVYGYKKFRVDSSGKPVSYNDNEYYTIDNERELTMLQPWKVSIIDEKTGKSKKSVTLEKGEKLIYYCTDGKSRNILKRSDETLVMFNVDTSSYPYTIDGTDIHQIFDGIMYAG